MRRLLEFSNMVLQVSRVVLVSRSLAWAVTILAPAKKRPIRIRMMPMTTRSSINVNR